MSGGKTWKATRKDFKREPGLFNKLYNPVKISELRTLLKGTEAVFKSNELVKKMCRKVMEEVTNIIEHNKTWNDISVSSNSNTSNSRCKIKIKYDGDEYYDPEKEQNNNVMGFSIKKFIGEEGYKREYEIKQAEHEVIIDLNFKVTEGED